MHTSLNRSVDGLGGAGAQSLLIRSAGRHQIITKMHGDVAVSTPLQRSSPGLSHSVSSLNILLLMKDMAAIHSHCPRQTRDSADGAPSVGRSRCKMMSYGPCICATQRSTLYDWESRGVERMRRSNYWTDGADTLGHGGEGHVTWPDRRRSRRPGSS
jgi:hypothetical protein